MSFMEFCNRYGVHDHDEVRELIFHLCAYRYRWTMETLMAYYKGIKIGRLPK